MEMDRDFMTKEEFLRSFMSIAIGIGSKSVCITPSLLISLVTVCFVGGGFLR